MSKRVVFDTNTVFSALSFKKGRLGWLLQHWRDGKCVPLISNTTAGELVRVLGYPRFRLSPADCRELLSDYIPYCETVEFVEPCMVQCRDRKDQPSLDLAHHANADALVSGDQDLLVLAGQTQFVIESPESYRRRMLRA